MTKLTLSMDEDVIATAKRIARRHNQRVSALLLNVVRAMAAQEKPHPEDIPPDSVVARLTGIIRLPPGMTGDDARFEALCDKYRVKTP